MCLPWPFSRWLPPERPSSYADAGKLILYWLPTSALPVYGKLLRPLRLHLRPEVEQTSAFLNLPVEILYSICDGLPLSSKILLSHTCKAMWYTLRDNGLAQTKTLAWKDRLNTLTELGNLLPDNYCCIKCRALHPVEHDDVPDVSNWKWRRHTCRTPVREFDRLFPQNSYAILFHQVQLAVKYSRWESKHQKYLRKILQEFEVCPADSAIIKKFTAKPKIVNGKFILLMTYVLYAASVQGSVRDLKKYISFCPHHHFGIGRSPRGLCFATTLQKSVLSATTTKTQHTELFSCDLCLTDYSVVAKGDEAVVKVWKDLGNGTSDVDPNWKSHIYSYHNGMLNGVQFDYEHGSISKLYDSCSD